MSRPEVLHCQFPRSSAFVYMTCLFEWSWMIPRPLKERPETGRWRHRNQTCSPAGGYPGNKRLKSCNQKNNGQKSPSKCNHPNQWNRRASFSYSCVQHPNTREDADKSNSDWPKTRAGWPTNLEDASLVHIHAIITLYSFPTEVDRRSGPMSVIVIYGDEDGIFLKYVKLIKTYRVKQIPIIRGNVWTCLFGPFC